MSELVSTNWVYKNLNNRRLVILDCSWHLTSKKRNALKDYRQSHIKNSIYFNILQKFHVFSKQFQDLFYILVIFLVF